MALSVNVRSIDVSKGFVVFVLCFSSSLNEMAVQSGLMLIAQLLSHISTSYGLVYEMSLSWGSN